MMQVRADFLELVLACALVTALPRVLPLAVLSRVALPGWLLAWLRYVPIAVLAALVAIEIVLPGGKLQWDGAPLAAIGVAFGVAAVSRNLLATVLSGVALYWLLA
jgi:branched-subunit amino acid transport protein